MGTDVAVRPKGISAPFWANVFIILLAVLAVHGAWLFLNLFSDETDYLIHYRWAYGFNESLKAGIGRPAWLAEGRGGLGDPVFLYYAPVFYYLTGAMTWLTADLWLSIKLVCVLGSAATGALALAFARANGLSPGPARAIAVLAIALPLFLVIRHYINAYPWFVALFFMLWASIALATYLQQPEPGAAAYLAFAVGLLCGTHILAGASFLLVAGMALGLDWLASDRSLPGALRVARTVLVLVLGMGVAATVLIPAVLGMDLITPMAWDHEDPRFSAWFNSFAMAVVTDVRRKPFNYVMPFGTFVLVPFLLLVAWRVRPRGAEGRPARVMLWLIILAALLSIEVSYPLWQAVEPLQIFQRPFRFVAPATMALLVAGTLLLACLQAPLKRSWRLGLYAVTALAVLPAYLVVAADSFVDWRAEKPILVPSPAQIERVFAQPEHLPATAGPGWRDYLSAGGFDAECAALGATCSGGKLTSHSFRWQVELSRAATVRVPVMGFPAWHLHVDGVPIEALPIDPDSGLVAVSLEAGTHDIALTWQELPTRMVGLWITIVSSVLCVILILWDRGRGGRPAKDVIGDPNIHLPE